MIISPVIANSEIQCEPNEKLIELFGDAFYNFKYRSSWICEEFAPSEDDIIQWSYYRAQRNIDHIEKTACSGFPPRVPAGSKMIKVREDIIRCEDYGREVDSWTSYIKIVCCPIDPPKTCESSESEEG